MGLVSDLAQRPQTSSPPSAPQFSSPSATQLLQQLLATYGQQSIKPKAPGSQGQAAGTPGALGGQYAGGPAFPNAIPSALSYLGNQAGNALFGNSDNTATSWNPTASIGQNITQSALPQIGSAIGAFLGF